MNRKLASRILILLVTVMTAAACEWRELDYEYIDTAKLTIIYDWSESGLVTKNDRTAVYTGDKINGRTAAFFPIAGGTPVIKYSHSDTVTVNLLVGEYRAVFFNETFEDFDNIRFEGINSFEDLEALAKEDIVATTRAGSTIARQPDILAVDMMIPFEVTEDMVRYTRALETKKTKGQLDSKASKAMEEAMTVIAKPKSVVYKVVLDIVVDGKKSIASSGAYVSGFAGGFDFSEGHANDISVTHKVNFTDVAECATGEGDAILSATFQCFGYRNGSSSPLSGYTLDFRASLINGEVFQTSRSLDDHIRTSVEDGHIVIHINIGDGSGGGGGGGDDPDDPESGNKPIVIPDVQPVDSGGGWQINVGDWDEIIIPIDM